MFLTKYTDIKFIKGNLYKKLKFDFIIIIIQKHKIIKKSQFKIVIIMEDENEW